MTQKKKSSTSLSSKNGNFDATISVSNPDLTYYYKAYAVVNGTESYANQSKEVIASSSNSFHIGLEPSVSVTTNAANNVDYVSATLSASFSDATSVPSEVGFVYGTSSSSMNSTIKATQPSGKSGTYSVNLDGLTPGCTYHFQPYAKVKGTGSFASSETKGNGTVMSFTTPVLPEMDPVDPAVDATWLELPGAVSGSNYVVNTYYGSSATEENRNYTHLYDKSTYTSLWTAYHLNSSHMGSGRSDDWSFNPQIEQKYQVDLTDHSYNDNYSRGHLIPNASRNGNSTMQSQTFYVTNSVPQIHNNFNGGIWQKLESALQSLAGSEEIYIVTGVCLNKVGESKTVTYTTAKDDPNKQVPVPNYFYKVVLKVNKSGSTVTSAKAIGFWFEHKTYTNDSYTNYSVSVDQIEKWTGFDFFVNLPDGVEVTAETNTSWSTFKDF